MCYEIRNNTAFGLGELEPTAEQYLYLELTLILDFFCTVT